MEILDIVEFDKDEALQEAAAACAEVERFSRLGFLRRAGAAGGVLAGTGALSGAFATSAWANTGGYGRRYERGRPPVSYGRGDIGVLNFALLLEHLEAAFYKAAMESGAISDPATRAFVELAFVDEHAHVEVLKSVLGSQAIKRPTFQFHGALHDQAKLQRTAFVLENTGVHAYLGQVRNIYSPHYLTVAAGIATVEGRHAAIIGNILGDTSGGTIVPNGPIDDPLSAGEVISAVNATGFITAGAPKGTGGEWTPPPTPEVAGR